MIFLLTVLIICLGSVMGIAYLSGWLDDEEDWEK